MVGFCADQREEAGAFSLADLRSRIGVVSQDIRLFEGSVRENLLLGRQGTDEELWEALRGWALTS